MSRGLAETRAQFDLPQDIIYLDGNSLGALPHRAKALLATTVSQEWGQDLIRSWNAHDWIDLPVTVGEKIAPLLGAGPGQVICTDSTSVNLFKLVAAALAARPGRTVVLSQEDNFPTDLYMVQGLAGLLGEDRIHLRTVPSQELEAALDDETALLLLTQVNFRDGYVHDIQSLTEHAHRAGALVVWDLSHSTGVLPLSLDEWDVDLAVGCGYKYLNGGPGAPAYLYVNRRCQAQLSQPLTGWMGHKRPFDFSAGYEAADGMLAWLSGTPPVLAMKALDAALDVYRNVDVQDIRAASTRMTEQFIALTASLPGITLVSPREPAKRGSQVSLQHRDAYAVMQALIAQGVIGDFRAPDLLRFGFAPLYNNLDEVRRAAAILSDILITEAYREPRFQVRQTVT